MGNRKGGFTKCQKRIKRHENKRLLMSKSKKISCDFFTSFNSKYILNNSI